MGAGETRTGDLILGMQRPPEIIRTLSTAVVPYRCLCLVAELAVADQIEDELVSVDELASQCRADADALNRVLRLLASYGIFRRVGRAYAHTPTSRLLRSDHSMSMRAFARWWGMPLQSAVFSNLEHSVLTGAPAVEAVEPNGAWAYFQHHPDEAQIFAQAMSARASVDIPAVLDAFDFSRFGTIADIGGGRGFLLQAVLDATPGAKGVLFDLPTVIDTFDIQHERLNTHAGDFFVDPLPAADAYLLMDVLHDWDDGRCVAILSAIHRAASPGATVLVIENVLGEEDEEEATRRYNKDVVMLAATGGRERTAIELGSLFNRAGFSNGRVTDTSGPVRIVEARAI
jgi:O-methyltransferase domain